jgi:hypothetical protein
MGVSSNPMIRIAYQATSHGHIEKQWVWERGERQAPWLDITGLDGRFGSFLRSVRGAKRSVGTGQRLEFRT